MKNVVSNYSGYVCVSIYMHYQQAAQQSVCSSSMFSVFSEAVSLAGRLAIANEKQEESERYTDTEKDRKKERCKRDKEKKKMSATHWHSFGEKQSL